MVINSLKAILGEDYTILSFERLPSRRNEVYKITGSTSSNSSPSSLVAKFYKQPGIAHETSILQEAHQHNLYVPTIIGSTAAVLALEYIDAPNLCDLITINPDLLFARLLATWLVKFHTTFTRENNQVLIKGDARIRNFLVQQDHLVGVDFEESHANSYHEDLAVACASILDTTPLFTHTKLTLCREIIDTYGMIRQIPNPHQLKSTVHGRMVQVLQATASRRGNPPQLLNHIQRFKEIQF
jgi:tRNA A-37 threonylcarbamoyl transferase component Bud32